ncbi:MAG TPA: SDR family NAD(P)-dependent oxidoreductase [Gemmatimonadota bacterium]|nr:SDR family NAD(P)-dependent oxidoreductase [Gemmatimonadota bacterium]
MSGLLQGHGAVVTGGGRGIGAATARALAAEGARVVLASRTEAEVASVAGDIAGAGGEAWGVPCDVTDADSVAALAEAAGERIGAVDILVNSAGIAHSAPLARQTLEEWERIFAVNVTGVFLVTRAFLPAMMERGRGRVVNVASVAGLAGAKYIAAYAASKHAVVGFTRSVAAEAAPRGVTVNALCPGYVDTDMTDASVARIMERAGLSETAALEAILATSPQGRLIEPGEVARAVTWLCEESTRGVNGQAIVIDGGGLLA